MQTQFKLQQQKYAERINRQLSNYIEELPDSTLKSAMKYSLLAGGKRIRPYLVYATGEIFGCPLALLDSAAIAIELIHSYSLIHDDLPAMDNDELRRGIPTCHIKYGEANAILAGDALQTLAFSCLAQANELSNQCRIHLIQELALASGVQGMCLGQALDLESEHKQISLDELNLIHANKTGALIRSAVRLGMYCTGEFALIYRKELEDYANAIGLAFQIQDDILDVIGDKTLMGKNSGGDSILEKSTYPSLLGLEQAKNHCEQLHNDALSALEKIPYNSESLKELANFIIKRNN